MKPLLSENGSVELGFGVIAALAGATWFIFPTRGMPGPHEGPGPFVSGILFAVGTGLAWYGYELRKAYNKKCRQEGADNAARFAEEEANRKKKGQGDGS